MRLTHGNFHETETKIYCIKYLESTQKSRPLRLTLEKRSSLYAYLTPHAVTYPVLCSDHCQEQYSYRRLIFSRVLLYILSLMWPSSMLIFHHIPL